MKIYRVTWTVPDINDAQAPRKKIAVFWNSDSEASLHVENLIRAFETLGYPSPASWVAKHHCNPGERFFE